MEWGGRKTGESGRNSRKEDRSNEQRTVFEAGVWEIGAGRDPLFDGIGGRDQFAAPRGAGWAAVVQFPDDGARRRDQGDRRDRDWGV